LLRTKSDVSHVPTMSSKLMKNFSATLLQEVIRADVSMHAMQIDAWQWFSQHLPKGELINPDLGDGIQRNLYLALSDVNLTFHVKPLRLSFWKRLVLAWKLVTGRMAVKFDQSFAYQCCPASDPLSMKMEIRITRFKNGTVKASYAPADEATAELMK